MMVSQQSNDDMFPHIPRMDLSGIDDNDEILLALLYLLEDFYDKYYTKSPKYILSHIDKDIDKLEKNISSKLNARSDAYIEDLLYKTMLSFNLTQDMQSKVVLEYDIGITLEVTESTLTAILEQLRQDIKTKALVWQDQQHNVDDFNIRANYNRATKRLTDAVKYYTTTTRQKVSRAVQKYVYGDNMLYNWVCLGRNPCEWCIENSKSPPRKVDEWELDHINGHCALIPATEEYSDEYKKLMGEL